MEKKEEVWRDAGYFCRKYQRSQVTVWRWERQGVLPKAKRINGRKFWPPETEPKFDDAGANDND